VIAKFDGGNITSDAGVLLLREVEKRTGLIVAWRGVLPITGCAVVEHSVEELLDSGCLEYVWGTKI